MADLPDVVVPAVAPDDALAQIWCGLGLDPGVPARLTLTGQEPVFQSSFAVGTAAQAAIAASALAATEIDARRDSARPPRAVSVDLADAARECMSLFTLDGITPPAWDPISGLYRCGRASDPDRALGWIRIHANFPHHRQGAIHLLGLGGRGQVTRADVERALQNWRAEDIEEAAEALGLPMAALRTTRQWQAHPQARLLEGQSLIEIEQIGDAPALPWPTPAGSDAPLAGLRVLDLTRVLAGPVGCRTLAALGADVLTSHAPGLPNIAALPDTSRGKRSTELDLAADADRLQALVVEADVFFEAARPGAIAAAGFGPQALHRMRPGIVAVSLDAWGDRGPWGGKRGFDSLVQTACGLNDDERQAFDGIEPRPLPVQILDYASGFLAAFGAQAALLRQREQGGSWRVHVSLARTALWLRSLGRFVVRPTGGGGTSGTRGTGSTSGTSGTRDTGGTGCSDESAADRRGDVPDGQMRAVGDVEASRPDDWSQAGRAVSAEALAAALRPFPSDFGDLRALPHAARFSRPWPVPLQPSRPPGSDAPTW